MTRQIIAEKRTMQLILVFFMFGSLQLVDAVVTNAVIQRIEGESTFPESLQSHSPSADSIEQGAIPESHGLSGTTMKLIYCASMLTICILVTAMYWKRSTAVILRIITYLLCLCIIKVSVRYVFEVYNFNYPKFVTGLHFLVSGGFCCCLLMCTSSFASKHRTVISWYDMMFRITPLAFVFASSVGVGNAALVYASTSFVEMMSSCTPVCTVVVALLFDQPFNKRLLWPVLVVCAGLAACAAGAIQFSLLGCCYALLATFLRSLKAVCQQILMGGSSASFEPVELLAWISLPSVILMMAWSAVVEGLSPYVMIANGDRHLLASIGISCVIACVLNVMATFVVKDLGAIGAQLTGQLKGVLTVLGGMAILNENIYPQQAVGYGIVLLGVAWYTQMETRLKAHEKTCDPESPADPASQNHNVDYTTGRLAGQNVD